MGTRFRVIEGGASAARPDMDQAAPSTAPVRWQVDLRRPSAVDDSDVSAWRALLTRIRVSEPFYADPDYLLTSAQHQVRDADLLFAFVWATTGDRDQLHGVIPIAMPHHLWGKGCVTLWQPPGAVVVPSIDPAASEDVRFALLQHLRSHHPTLTLELAPAVRRPSAFERVVAPLRLARSEFAGRVAIPSESLVGVRSADAPHSPAREIERISDPLRIRDAVETFLSLDARVSGDPIVNDPSEAAMVRVVMRRFAERRLVSVELARRDGAVVAAKLHLGFGPKAVVWRAADEDQSGASIHASARAGG